MRHLELNDVVGISGIHYSVKGYIDFHDHGGNQWTEYRLSNNGYLVWLSVDDGNGEYVLTDKRLTGDQYDKQFRDLFNGGGEDSGQARVVKARGNVDAEPGDSCRYYDIFDKTDQYVLSQEIWEDETEYSRGRFIELNQIIIVDKKVPTTYYEQDYTNNNNRMGYILAGGLAVIVLCLAIGGISFKPKQTMRNYLKTHSEFQRETTVTGDTYTDLKAEVYRTYLSVDEAMSNIVAGCGGNVKNVNGAEDKSVISIMTKDEYGVVYRGEDEKTYVQVSTREYCYANNNTLFLGSMMSNNYYRGHYYQYGYGYDARKYHKRRSAYTNFVSMGLAYKDYYENKSQSSGSTRRGSTGTRSSGSGGISSGK